ncbi:hypothetical protein [Kitasatospora cineracea]|uniref:hypothetical protein n=1 Tax=Kitasatospora cineracea TaxID=88074 RepID=UPI0034102148
MAIGAWRDRQIETTEREQAEAYACVYHAEEFAAKALGTDPAALLTWKAVPVKDREVYAARADLPDTPGWSLRWATGPDGTALLLHRPCAEGGHRNRVRSLASLGAYLAKLADR